MTETIRISKSLMDKLLLLVSVVATILVFLFFKTPYTPTLVFVTLLLVWGSYYTFLSKEKMSEMCCMMSGMVFGMISGFFIGALAGLATGDFLVGMIAGTVAGVIFGIPIGRIGGPLGRMEGVMAGPMGGIMGGMTGVMVRFFDVGLFMPFFILVILFTIWEMTRVVHGHAGNISRNFVYVGVILSLLAFSSTLVNNYSIDASLPVFARQQGSVQSAQAAPISNGAQEVTLKMEALGYDPNYIVLKKDVPAKINLEASPTAGCTRSIVFPDFGIRKTVPRGGTSTVEFTPTKAGTFRFSCAMSMAGGTIVVQ